MDDGTKQQLELHLQKAFGCPALTLGRALRRNATIELRRGEEVIGTVDQVEDEGERSWAVTVVVLEDDLVG